MATANEYISKAASYIGVGGTDNMFNTWIWGRHVYDPDTYPWCAAFQSYVAVHDLGMGINPSASAAGVANQGRRIDDSEVQPGDWVVFNWDGRTDTGWCDHIGLVEWFDHSTGYFGTIEGNCDDVVTRVTRYNYSSYFTAFFRPPYDGHESAPKPAPSYSDDIRYRVCVDDHGSRVWLPEMVGLYSTDGCGDDFAGEVGLPICGIAISGVGKYRVYSSGYGWLDWVDGYDIRDEENGYAGYRNAHIECLQIPNPKVRYAVKDRNGGWHPDMVGNFDTGGSGDDFAGDFVAVDAVRIRWDI